MKRILRVILLIFVILIPLKISALSVDSGLISVNKMDVNVELGDVLFNNVTFVYYNNYKNTREKGYAINASFISTYEITVDVKAVVKLYNSSKTILKTYEDVYTLESNIVNLYEKGEKYSAVDNVAYYSIYLELMTEISEPTEKEKLTSDYYIDKNTSNILIKNNREIKYNQELNVSFEHGNNYFNYYIPVKEIYVLKDLKINNDYVKELEKGVHNIRIGSKDNKFYNQDNIFKISYTLDYGNDYYKKNDSIDLDIVNTFSNIVKNVDFIIVLPKIGDMKDLSFYLNGERVKVKYKINGNIIKGSYGVIKSDSVLSTIIVFNEGYFTNTNSLIDSWIKTGLILPITSLLITIIIFLLIRNKKIMTKEVDMKLLTNYSSLEVGYLYNDKLDYKDIMSMILSLANKGYIKIEKSKNGFVLKKIKNYDGENEFEKDLLDGIFYDNVTIKEEQLYYMDSSFIGDIKYNIEYKYQNKFYNNYFNRYILIIISCYISLFVITYRPLSVFDHTYLILGVSLSLVIFSIIFVILNSRFKLIERLIGYLSILVFYSFLVYFVILPSLKISGIYEFIYIIGIISIVGCLYLYRMVPKRKKSSNKLLRNINRLKKEIYNNRVDDNELFLQLLPYTYAMDCYDIYTANNTCENVSWYEDKEFVYSDFVSNIKTLLANITYDLTYNEKDGVNK